MCGIIFTAACTGSAQARLLRASRKGGRNRMFGRTHKLPSHEAMLELAAASQAEPLFAIERIQLQAHLSPCAACREASEVFDLLCTTGRHMVQGGLGAAASDLTWEHERQKNRLLASFRTQSAEQENSHYSKVARIFSLRPSYGAAMATAGVVFACVLIGYQFGRHQMGLQLNPTAASSAPNLRGLLRSKAQVQTHLAQSQEKLRASDARIESLTSELALTKASRAQLKSRLTSLASQLEQRDAIIEANGHEKQALGAQLAESDDRLRGLEQELANARGERARELTQVASAEMRMQQLSAELQEKDRTIAQQQQFLDSDRDIRDLMGARQLLIADVVDVDHNGRSRTPFGRIFYTKGKSLIFYGFDLDLQAEVPTARVFSAVRLNA